MREAIKDFFSKGRSIDVLVIGDVMLDTYIRGTVDRISPEAPVQVLEWQGEDSIPGGAANVACNLAALGCKVRLLGVVGSDSRGGELRGLLQRSGVDVSGLLTCGDRPTTHKTRVIAHNQQVIRIDREDRSPLSEEALKELLDLLERNVSRQGGIDGVICSDYAKGLLVPNLMERLLRTARDHSVPVVVDPKGEDYAKYSGCTSITPNEKELSQATRMSIKSDTDLERAAQALMNALGPTLGGIMITRGERGVSVLTPDGAMEHIPAESKEVYDVTGAGDTVVSVFGMTLFGGLSLREAAVAANAAGGIVVAKLGTSVVTREELLHHFQNPAGGGIVSKVVELEHLKEELNMARLLGKKIVFTNGCFDPIHKGHISLLEQASELGEILIVGLNSDSSVRKLKGPNRPSVQQEDRAYILAALESVSHVIIFHEDTPLNLIREIRPDYLVKGADYKADEVVGREFVETYGGEVKLIPLVPDKSSTQYLMSVVEKNR